MPKRQVAAVSESNGAGQECPPHTRSADRFRADLLAWFDLQKRDLPWRRDRDPYRVWVSEIMLQQTRVAAVLDHYRRFLRRFPNIKKLAAAREASVLAAWSGLGYYRRARMMHAAAREIVRQRDEVFPQSAEELAALPGIGRYTAAAIASIAFNQSVAAVDGNVTRVLERIKGRTLSEQPLWQVAEELLDRQRPGDFNQAMMELGAIICLPRQPKCLLCPLAKHCVTRGQPLPKEKAPAQKRREIHYLFDRRNGSLFLVKRPASESLMPGMWELPEIEANGNGETWLRLRHSITVTNFDVRVIRGAGSTGVKGKWVPPSRISTLPLTGLARKILRAAKVI